ncbi:MAG: DUF922 domain-containing protein [Polyangiaceae bacterium]
MTEAGPSHSPAAPPGLEIAERVVHYWVAGFTSDQILRAMRVAGPRRAGASYAAYTDWAVEWTRERVFVDVTIHLPKWIEPSAPPAELKARWGAFVAGLEAHEAGHRDIAVGAGTAVLALLRSGDVHASPALARAIERTIEDAREAERVYDRETQHGEIERIEEV